MKGRAQTEETGFIGFVPHRTFTGTRTTWIEIYVSGKAYCEKRPSLFLLLTTSALRRYRPVAQTSSRPVGESVVNAKRWACTSRDRHGCRCRTTTQTSTLGTLLALGVGGRIPNKRKQTQAMADSMLCRRDSPSRLPSTSKRLQSPQAGNRTSKMHKETPVKATCSPMFSPL